MAQRVYRDGKVHVMSERCSTCVFHPGNLMNLPAGRFQDLVERNRSEDTAFACHQTLYRTGVEHSICRGYYDAYKHETTPLRIAERRGVIEFDEID
jgi:hypothetical protein